MLDEELAFISGQFFDYVLPKDKMYLYKYFTSDSDRQFVRYFLLFKEVSNFVDRTGFYISKPWLRRLKSKFTALENAYEVARKTGDFELIGQIELGNYKS